jgi:hypothetical protein
VAAAANTFAANTFAAGCPQPPSTSASNTATLEFTSVLSAWP